MPLRDDFRRLPLDQVLIDRERRQRREIDTKDLEASIAKRGVLNPIIVEPMESGFKLIAGERRVAACRNLGLDDIPARFMSELSVIEAQIIELEENIKRKDLPWQDICGAISRIHQLFCSQDSGWTISETAQEIGLSVGNVSEWLRINAEMSDERIQEAGTQREAYNIILRREQRAAGDALQDLLDEPEPQPTAPGELRLVQPSPIKPTAPPPPSPEAIIQASFLEWAPRYAGPKFNFVHCDFPYGVNLFDGPQGRGSEPAQGGQVGYLDSVEVYQELLESFCRNLDRFMSISAHLMFWCSAEYKRLQETLATFHRLAPSLVFSKFPLIWLKSDNAGISSSPNKEPRHVYELCLFASRGARHLVQIKSDAYAAPTDKRYHVSTKPEPMLKHFMGMIVDQTSTVLDPTCGSGAALRAAEALGARRVLGIEIDHQACEVARMVLKQSRQLRAASGQ